MPNPTCEPQSVNEKREAEKPKEQRKEKGRFLKRQREGG